jgi:hypothetical protein
MVACDLLWHAYFNLVESVSYLNFTISYPGDKTVYKILLSETLQKSALDRHNCKSQI